MSGAKPRPTPCAFCPYRRDVPSGVWAPSEYVKLIGYDAPTGDQPPGVFMCHEQTGSVCAGWASVHGDTDNLALRLAVSLGSGIDRDAVLDYSSPVPLFEDGCAAAEHGLADVIDPGEDARKAVAKLLRAREARRRK